ncbi:MAG: hypothetical protein HY696_04115 [Deltaproteobacteria bacterium]|nr:hypothetical protein [Deltaproteobacteria bacterium]
MTPMTTTELDEFANALQLCIKSRVKKIVRNPSGGFVIRIDQRVTDDAGLRLATRLLPGHWNAGQTVYEVTWPSADPALLPLLTQFLLLTRLQPRNILALANQTPRYRALVEQLGDELPAASPGKIIADLAAARHAIFTQIEAQQFTLRAVAEAGGITQVTLSKFKAGGDIMLSTFLKIAAAVGYHVTLKRDGKK